MSHPRLKTAAQGGASSGVGFIFQTFNLFPTLTAGENVQLMLDLKGVPKTEIRSRARELLDQV